MYMYGQYKIQNKRKETVVILQTYYMYMYIKEVEINQINNIKHIYPLTLLKRIGLVKLSRFLVLLEKKVIGEKMQEHCSSIVVLTVIA